MGRDHHGHPHHMQTMAYFYLDQLLYPSESASASQRGRKRCGPGGDMCDKKRAARRAHWEAHFAANGPHGPWGRHHHDHHHPHHGHWDGAQASRAMPIDFVEKDGGFEVLADVPGVDKSNIKLSVEGDVLTIKVEKEELAAAAAPSAADGEAEPSDNGGNGSGSNGGGDVKYHQHERSSEFPSRVLRFPDNADLANVKASYVNGVLKLEVPKLPATVPQQITIE